MAARIRFVDPSDADAIAAIYRPVVETTTISFETVPLASDEIARRIAETVVTHPWLVCEIGGRVAGYAYATRHRVRAAYRWSVDTSVYVDTSCRRCGVGLGLYASLRAALTAQGYVNAFAGISLPNPASVGLHEAVGFKAIGVYRSAGYKLGAWLDVGWWQLALQSPAEPPSEPLEIGVVRTRPDWAVLLNSGASLVRGDIPDPPEPRATR